MSFGKKVIRCIKCGAAIQSDDKDSPGYVDKQTYDNRENLSVIYCNSCYEIITEINNVESTVAVDKSLLNVFDDAIKSKALIIWSIDLFSFNGVLPNDLARKLKNNKIVVVGTRKDIFPLPFNEKKVHDFIKYSFSNYDIEPCNIICLNARNKKEVLNAVNKVKCSYAELDTLDMYLVGSTNSGKTSLISTFLKNYENTSNRQVSTVYHKNSGLQLLEMPLSNRRTFYEVPGYSCINSVISKVEKSIHKYITPIKTIKVTTSVLHKDDAIMLGGIAGFEIKDGIPTTYRFFSGEGLEMLKCKTNKITQNLYKNIATKTIKPVSERLNQFTDYDLIEFNIPNDNVKHEIAVQGLGFVIFNGKGQRLWVIVPKGVSVNEGLGRY